MLFYKLIDTNKSTKNDGRKAGQGLATRMGGLAPARVVSLVTEYLLENAGFYAKNQKSFQRSDTIYFQVEKMEEKKRIRLTETVQSAG